MKILVTGGAGFIGSHLCKRLLALNNQVICVDNFFTGQKKNISDCIENKNFILIEHDIIEPLYVDGEVDQIYNLACPASPVHYQKNSIRTVKANVLGVINILGLSKEKKCKILQASTSEVYGDPDDLHHPQKENYNGNVNPIGPRACYDEGKRCAETLFFDYHRTHKISIAVARIFNTYGPQMAINDGRVVSNFILQALKNDDIIIYGDGNQTRSFCYVDDMVDGLIKLMETRNFTGPVNLGNCDEYQIIKLAQMIIDKTGSKSKIVFKELPQDDPKQRQPDLSLAKEKLNWQPQVKLEEGLEKTIGYFRKIV
ncbi:SDR family oxidoreductase [Candidatus Parcubacteria bacterium]|nr:MAG: SDR family oxidoreductase [Candidatus Parcubacteria bacterium]